MIIYAPNVHQGGGKVLLESLLRAATTEILLYSDNRLNLTEDYKNVRRLSFAPSLWGRLSAELTLWKTAKQTDTILFFGNLPPLFFPKGKRVLFFQNSILLSKYSGFAFPFKTKIKHALERLWLKWNLYKIKKVFVQSNAILQDFTNEFPKASLSVLPFNEIPVLVKAENKEKKYDYLYVAAAEPHKNHQNLFSAWKILADKKIFPSLALTISNPSPIIQNQIDELQRSGCKITNLRQFEHSQLYEVYSSAKALIFPSLTESFGLPLIEAQIYGLDIIASELDFVREFVQPIQSFNPYSPTSIARAVSRHLQINQTPPKIHSAPEFLKDIQQL